MTKERARRAGWWWIDRWRKSTAYTDMTLAEQGAYRNLLDELWLRGGVLPLDERILAKVCGDALEWPKVKAAVLARFRRTAEGWRNDTHDEVSAGTIEAIERQREKGRKRAAEASRDAAGRYPKVQPDIQPKDQPEVQPENQPSGSGSVLRTPEQDPSTENDLVPLRGTGRLGRGLKALIPGTRPAESGPEFEVFAYWRERCGKAKATWTHDRKRVLTRRLAEDPDGVAGLKLAVDGAVADPLHNGTEKGTRYWEFENLFVHGGRNRVEKLQGAATRNGPTLSDGSRKTLTAAEAWLARKGAS